MSLYTLKSLIITLFFTCILSACGGSEEKLHNNKFDPSLTFASNIEINEGEAVTIDFTLDKSTLHEVSFDYEIIDDSAKNSIDFQASSDNVVIESGKKSASIKIQTIDNLTALANANFQILISNVKGANVENKLIEVVIIDNEPQLSFANKFSVTEGQEVTIELTLSAPASQQIAIHYQTSATESGEEVSTKQLIDDSSNTDITTIDIAKKGEDFAAIDTIAYIEEGQSSTSISINTYRNSSSTKNQFFYFLIKKVEGARLIFNQSKIEITDNDPEISFDSSYSVAEGQEAQVTLTLSKAVDHRVEVYYKTLEQESSEPSSDDRASKHIAKAGKDFPLLDEIAFFEPGETTSKIPLPTFFNYTTHEDLYFNFQVVKANGASFTQMQSRIVITDNEPLLSFQNRFFVEEGDGVSIEFELPRGADHEISLKYETSEGTAIAGSDYQHSSGIISIKNTYDEDGKILYRTKLNVSTIAKDAIQADREFYFNIIDINGARSNIQQATIAISDAVENINFGFNKSQTMASYQAGNIVIEVNKSKASTEELTIPFALSGTAVNNVDYNLIEDDDNTANTVTFASEKTTAYINLQVIDNGLPRSSSNIRLKLNDIGLIELNDNDQHDIVLIGALALNDTGALTGDDSKHGRDNDSELNQAHDGAAGFSFTKVSAQGNKLADDARTYSCVADNVTGLVYEAKQQTPEKAHTYNARLSDAELILLVNTKRKNIEFVTYQDVYDVFPSPDNDGHDFEQITGKKFDAMLDSEKNESAFTVLTDLTKKELTFLLTDSKRQAGNTLEYPFNYLLEIQHINWRSSDHNYYWLNKNTSSNGGRNGSEGKLLNTKLPISRFCGFPHEEESNYVDDISGCNSSDYLKVMNNLAICGFTDWRLPKIEELRSIVNYELNARRWDGAFLSFTNELGNYISDSPSVSNDATVWCVAGDTGEVKLCHKQQPNYIRAVRGNSDE